MSQPSCYIGGWSAPPLAYEVLKVKHNLVVAEVLHCNTFWDKMIPSRTERVHFFGVYELSN